MGIDTSLLGQLCARAMEDIAERFESSEDVEIRTCAVIVEVDSPSSSRFWWSCSDDRTWVAKALLYETVDALDAAVAEVRDRDVDDDD